MYSMYNKEKVKEGLKKIRCIYKDADPNFRFTVYTGTYAGWSWSLVVSERMGNWRFGLLSLTCTFFTGASVRLSWSDVLSGTSDYDYLTTAIAVAAYEVIEKYDLWRKSYDFDYPAKNQ